MAFDLLIQFVWEVCKKGLQTVEERVHITTPQFAHKLADIKAALIIRHEGIIRNQKIHEAVPNLVIGEFQ